MYNLANTLKGDLVSIFLEISQLRKKRRLFVSVSYVSLLLFLTSVLDMIFFVPIDNLFLILGSVLLCISFAIGFFHYRLKSDDTDSEIDKLIDVLSSSNKANTQDS